MSTSLPFPLNPPIHKKPYLPFHYPISVLSTPKPYLRVLSSKSIICYASNHSYYEREEIRWLREEQRWLREEKRWLREEQRWSSERESLLREIAELKLRIQALERLNTVQGGTDSASEMISKIAGLLQLLKEKNRIAESGTGASPMVLEERRDEAEVEKEVVVDEVVRVTDGEKLEEKVKKKSRRTLRKGSEGAEVREMQVCSQFAFLL